MDEPGRPLLRCSGCRDVWFCDAAHQAKAWPTHRDYCRTHRQPRGTASVPQRTGPTDLVKRWHAACQERMTIVALAALAPDLTPERMASTILLFEIERNEAYEADHPLAFRIVSGRIVPVEGYLDTLLRPPYAKYAPTMSPDLVRRARVAIPLKLVQVTGAVSIVKKMHEQHFAGVLVSLISNRVLTLSPMAVDGPADVASIEVLIPRSIEQRQGLDAHGVSWVDAMRYELADKAERIERGETGEDG